MEDLDLDSGLLREFVQGHALDIHIRPPSRFHDAFGDVQSFLIGQLFADVIKREQHGTIGITTQRRIRHKHESGAVLSIHVQDLMDALGHHDRIFFLQFQGIERAHDALPIEKRRHVGFGVDRGQIRQPGVINPFGFNAQRLPSLAHETGGLIRDAPHGRETAHPQHAFLIDFRNLLRVLGHGVFVKRIKIGRRHRGAVQHFHQVPHGGGMRHHLLPVPA